jgi:hypothetical protein
MDQQIDFVITWVDGQDEQWKQQKRSFAHDGNVDDSEERYRDWGLLKYWFRGVERYAPWVRKVHFVTWGHLPEWLDTSNPKLHIVRHEDYIPKEYLPTFNSNVLEIYLHRIEGLSEHFVYFNDDVFPIRELKSTDFFVKGRPCDMLAFQPVVANSENPVMSHLFLNNTLVLAKYFKKRENVRQQPWNYFKPGYPPLYFFYNLLEMAFPLYTGFYTVHGASPFCKSTFEEIWNKEGKSLETMSGNRFRNENDLTPYLFREWQKLSGNFCAKNIQKSFQYFAIQEDNTRLVKTIQRQKKKIICINDGSVKGDYECLAAEIQGAFESILPNPSSFEL